MYVVPFQYQETTKYLLSLIDGRSKFKWKFLIEMRENVFDMFMEFIKYLETNFERTPNVLRSNGAGEFSSKRMQSQPTLSLENGQKRLDVKASEGILLGFLNGKVMASAICVSKICICVLMLRL